MTQYRIVSTTDHQNLGMIIDEPEISDEINLISGMSFIVENKSFNGSAMQISNSNYIINCIRSN